jgi:hypothetical protein
VKKINSIKEMKFFNFDNNKILNKLFKLIWIISDGQYRDLSWIIRLGFLKENLNTRFIRWYK